jgi:hypothetical protein
METTVWFSDKYRNFSTVLSDSQSQIRVCLIDIKFNAKMKKPYDLNSKAQNAARIDWRQVISFHPASYQEGSRVVGRIFRIYEKITGGADGSVAGLNGSIRPLVRILRALEIQAREFIDFGAGDGRVLLPAILGSATKASARKQGTWHNITCCSSIDRKRNRLWSRDFGT